MKIWNSSVILQILKLMHNHSEFLHQPFWDSKYVKLKIEDWLYGLMEEFEPLEKTYYSWRIGAKTRNSWIIKRNIDRSGARLARFVCRGIVSQWQFRETYCMINSVNKIEQISIEVHQRQCQPCAKKVKLFCLITNASCKT